jgi:hypothetical protein
MVEAERVSESVHPNARRVGWIDSNTVRRPIETGISVFPRHRIVRLAGTVLRTARIDRRADVLTDQNVKTGLTRCTGMGIVHQGRRRPNLNIEFDRIAPKRRSRRAFDHFARSRGLRRWRRAHCLDFRNRLRYRRVPIAMHVPNASMTNIPIMWPKYAHRSNPHVACVATRVAEAATISEKPSLVCVVALSFRASLLPTWRL